MAAGAGYGKTTLVASWLDHRGVGIHAAWVTMGSEDNDPAVFVDHLHQALADAGMLPRSGRCGPTPAELVTAAASRATSRRPLVLVIDDAHVITSPAVHAELAALVRTVPDRACVVVIGREELPLGWGALQARGTAVQVLEDDLVLDTLESGELLTAAFGVSATDEEAEQVVRLTEGWATGVCLAGLAMARERDDRGVRPRRTWLTSARHGARAFLDEEALADCSDEELRFLEDTSLLPTLLPALCDATTGRDDSHEVLRRLTSARLFTEAMEGEEDCYRYHPLFADALQTRLHQRDPTRRAILLTRAARWLEDDGRLFEATDLLVDAEAPPELVEALVRRASGPAVAQGHAASVARWLRALPDGWVASRPDLALVLARTSGITGDFVTSRAMLNAAEEQLASDSSPDPGLRLALTHARVSASIWAGHLDDVIEPLVAMAEDDALGDETPDGVLVALGLTRGSVLSTLAAAQLFQGQFDAAQRTAAEVVVPGEVAPVTRYLVLALGVRALALAWSGEDAAARRAIDEALACAATLPANASESLLTWVAVAWVGSADQAEAHRADILRAAGSTTVPIMRCLPALADVRRQTRLNRPDLAREALVRAREAVSDLPQPGYLQALLVDLDIDVDEQDRERPDLSARELELLRLLDAGATRREVAEQTNYSIDTVKYHLKAAYRKLDVETREAALSHARAWGLLDPPGEAAEGPGAGGGHRP